VKTATLVVLTALSLASCSTNGIPAKAIKPAVDELHSYVPELIQMVHTNHPDLWDQRLENLNHLKALVDQEHDRK
jgi:hypothetical protein